MDGSTGAAPSNYLKKCDPPAGNDWGEDDVYEPVSDEEVDLPPQVPTTSKPRGRAKMPLPAPIKEDLYSGVSHADDDYENPDGIEDGEVNRKGGRITKDRTASKSWAFVFLGNGWFIVNPS